MRSLSEHASEARPVEFGTCDWQGSPHALKDVTEAIVHRLDRLLVLSFSFVDSGDNVLTVGSGKRDVRELLLEGELNVSRLKVVVVDLDRAGD